MSVPTSKEDLDLYVYNPVDDDENPACFYFNGVQLKLLPNQAQVIPNPRNVKPIAGILPACLSQLGGLGVAKLTGTPDVDAKIIEASERVHAEHLRLVYSGILSRWAVEQQNCKDAGLTCRPEPAEVRKAKTQLSKKNLLIQS